MSAVYKHLYRTDVVQEERGRLRPVAGGLRRTHSADRYEGRASGMRAMLAILPLVTMLVFAACPGDAWARYASIVIDERTGETLHAANPDTPRYPASLTKMMTLYLLFQEIRAGRIGLDDRMPVSSRAEDQPPTKIGLTSDQTIRVEDAIVALVVHSANDVATVVAETVAGSEADFARRMTEQAGRLGMHSTRFRNASGLPDENQVSTARDMALLLMALHRDFPAYYPYLSREQLTWNGRTIRTHNRLVLNYPGADGGKTGYIRASGFNVATSAERNGHRLIGVVFGGQTASRRDRHMAALLDKAFKQDSPVRLAAAPPSKAPAVAAPRAVEPSKPARRTAIAAKATAPAASGSWGIQVGAFSSFEAATGAATQALRKVAARGAQVNVTTVPRGNRSPLYRARVIGLTEKTARAACRGLPKGCYPVANPGSA